jgi:hypothetical protein
VLVLRREPFVVIVGEAALEARLEGLVLLPGHVVAGEAGYVDDVAGRVGGNSSGGSSGSSGLLVGPGCGCSGSDSTATDADGASEVSDADLAQVRRVEACDELNDIELNEI